MTGNFTINWVSITWPTSSFKRNALYYTYSEQLVHHEYYLYKMIRRSTIHSVTPINQPTHILLSLPSVNWHRHSVTLISQLTHTLHHSHQSTDTHTPSLPSVNWHTHTPSLPSVNWHTHSIIPISQLTHTLRHSHQSTNTHFCHSHQSTDTHLSSRWIQMAITQ